MERQRKGQRGGEVKDRREEVKLIREERMVFI